MWRKLGDFRRKTTQKKNTKTEGFKKKNLCQNGKSCMKETIKYLYDGDNNNNDNDN